MQISIEKTIFTNCQKSRPLTRENSPAFLVDIKKGDKLIEINGKRTSDMSLQQINELFSSEENRKIKVTLIRNSMTLSKEFVLKDPIPYQEN